VHSAPDGPARGNTKQFNQVLGLPLPTPSDVEAMAFHPQFSVFFSLDGDEPENSTCVPMLVQDGAVAVGGARHFSALSLEHASWSNAALRRSSCRRRR